MSEINFSDLPHAKRVSLSVNYANAVRYQASKEGVRLADLNPREELECQCPLEEQEEGTMYANPEFRQMVINHLSYAKGLDCSPVEKAFDEKTG